MEPLSPLEPTLLGAIWRHRLLVLACGLIAVALAFVLLPRDTKEYQARASVVLRIPGPSFSDSQTPAQPARYTADQIAILESRPVAERALEVAGREQLDPGYGAEAVMARSKVTGTVEKNNVVRVSFRDSRPEVAVAMANALITGYRESRQSRSEAALQHIDRSLETVERELSALRGDIDRAQLRSASPAILADLLRRQDEILERANTLRLQRDALQMEIESGGTSLFAPATRAAKVPAAKMRKMAIALGAGLLLGTVVAYILALRRPRFSRREEPEVVLGAPLLSEIPEGRKVLSTRRKVHRSSLPVVTDRHSPEAEAFRFAAAFLEIQTNAETKVIAFVSANGEGDGTTAAVNTAIAMAQAGVRVALVDADVEAQMGSQLVFGEESRSGLSLAGESFQLFRPMGAALKSRDFLDLLEATGGRTLITPLFQELKGQFDVVIVDVPSLLTKPYAATFVSCAEGAVVVVKHEDPVGDSEQVASRLESIGTPAVGYVYDRSGQTSRNHFRPGIPMGRSHSALSHRRDPESTPLAR